MLIHENHIVKYDDLCNIKKAHVHIITCEAYLTRNRFILCKRDISLTDVVNIVRKKHNTSFPETFSRIGKKIVVDINLNELSSVIKKKYGRAYKMIFSTTTGKKYYLQFSQPDSWLQSIEETLKKSYPNANIHRKDNELNIYT